MKQWDKVKLGEVADFLDNKRRPLNNIEREVKRGDGTYPYFGANGMVDRIDEYIFDEPICCIAEDGGYWGGREKCSYLVNEKCWVNNHAHVVRSKGSLELPFLSYFLNFSNLNSYVTGTTRGKLTKGALERIKIPLPPLAEQRRIASILDRADQVRRLRVQTLERLDELVAALFLDSFGDPASNPKGWPIVSFGSVCDVRLGKMLDAKKQTGQHPRPYLRNANVQWHHFDLKSVFEMDFDAKDQKTFRLKPNDLLICEGGEPGRAAIWRGQIEECYFQKALHRARPHADKANADYLAHLLFFMSKCGLLLDNVTAATIAHLTGEKLNIVKIPLPPLSLQQQFAARVEAIESIKTRAREALVESQALFASLQHRAFEGEL